MTRYLIPLVLLLASCAAYAPAEGRATLTAEAGVITLRSERPILGGSFAITGAVVSEHYTETVGPFAMLRLPDVEQGFTLELGTYTGPVDGFGVVIAEGLSEGLEVTLEVIDKPPGGTP